jgi:hypothetical protein
VGLSSSGTVCLSIGLRFGLALSGQTERRRVTVLYGEGWLLEKTEGIASHDPHVDALVVPGRSLESLSDCWQRFTANKREHLRSGASGVLRRLSLQQFQQR